METYKNLFKRQDVFRCYYETHKKFSNVVSVWHILEERNCYPQGCISFYLKCKKILKGQRCGRGFKKPGKLCQSCKYLIEEKNHYIPKIILKEEEWKEFKFEYNKFLFWIKSQEQKTLKFYAKIESIKPYIKHIYYDKGSKFLLKGYFLILKWVYFENVFFDDMVFLYIPKNKIWKLKKLKSDEIEGFSNFSIFRGNLFLSNVKNLINVGKEEIFFREDMDVLLKLKLSSVFNNYQGKCFDCDKGVPAVVENQTSLKFIPKREIICLEGYSHPSLCLHNIYKNIKIEKCAKEL